MKCICKSSSSSSSLLSIWLSFCILQLQCQEALPFPLLDHSTTTSPNVLWNANIQSPGPTNGNVVQLVNDDWLYVTSSDGTISKINPRNGEYVNIYKPEVLSDDWIMYGGKGLSFYHSKEEGGDESGGGRFDINNNNNTDNDSSDGYSYLLYWVIDVPKTSDSNNVASSRIIAIKHDDDDEEELNVLWTKRFVGTISGTPVIG